MANRATATVSLREQAYTSFTERLLAREIRPGQFASQRELVEITGMPLSAIREMIPRLEADGLVRTVPQRGIQICQVDLDLIRNAFQFRQILEREAMVQFCRNARDEEIAAIREQHLEVQRQAEQQITIELIDHAQQMDWAFHDKVIDAMGNALISNAYRVNAIKIRLIRQYDTRILPELITSVLAEHMRIIDAMAARDEAATAAAIEAHIDSGKRRALEV